MKSRRVTGDVGASLVLVLVFVLSFGLIVPALLGLAQTNVGSVVHTRDQARTSYDADLAAQTAVNAIRNTPYDNAPGQACFADPANPGAETANLQFSTPNTAGQKALVTCQPGAGSGFPSTIQVPINNLNRPGTALLTLSRNAGEDGVYQGANNIFRIHGRVFSNSTINVHVSSAKLLDDRDVFARTGCNGNGQVLGVPVSCNDTTHDSLGLDPGYAQPGTVPAYQSVPLCAGAKKTYVFQPGYYDDAAALSALTQNSCNSSLLLFQAGQYYFDFHDIGSHVWSVSDGYVVAGKPRTAGTGAWNPANYPASSPPVPGSCITPLESQTNGGVQFIFGNDSRVAVSSGAKMEVCGQYSLTSPPIGLFGAYVGNETTTTLMGTAPSAATSTGNPRFLNPSNVDAADVINTADAAFIGASGGGNVSATLTATGLSPLTALPKGTVLVSAKVRIRHRDVATTSGSKQGAIQTLGLTLTPNRAGGPLNVLPGNTVTPQSDASTTALHEEAWDFTNALTQEVHDNGFNGAQLALTATTRRSVTATEQVDSLLLDLSYKLPAFRAQDLPGSCVGQVPYTSGGGGGCAMLSITGPGTAFYSQGTTYSPRAAIDVTLSNISQQVFKYGLITRTLRFDITGSSTFDQAVIAVPDDNTGPQPVTDVAVYLQVYLCPSGTCSGPPNPMTFGWTPPVGSGWTRRLASRAEYSKPSGARTVTVKDWAYSR